MANEVEIIVTGDNRSRPIFNQVRREGLELRDILNGVGRSARQSFDTVASNARRAEQSVDRLGDETRSTSSEIGGMGKLGDFAGNAIKASMAAAAVAIGATLVLAIRKVKDFTLEARDAASNLGESYNAVGKIFGPQAQMILDWGKANATAFGLSQRAFNEMATPLGAMLKNNGFALADVSRLTIDLTKRASDMASVFNTDVMDALMAIQAGLRGESDPLERYGVSLNEARVQAEALAMTGKKSAEKLTDQEKAAARLALIFKQTADVAGDFQGTSDGLANSTRILTARQEELKAKVGAELMPIFIKWNELKLKAVEILDDKLGPAAGKMLGWMREIGDKVGPAVRDAFQRINEILEKYDKEIALIKEEMKDLIPLIAVTLVVAIDYAVRAFEGAIRIAAFVSLQWAIMKERIRELSDTFLAMVGQFIEGAARAFGWMPGIGPKLKEAAKDFAAFRDAVNNALNGIKDRTVNVKVVYRETTGRGLPGGIMAPGLQHGGVGSGLTFVAERGRELMDLPGLVNLPPGSRVRSAEDTRRVLANAGDTVPEALEIEFTGDLDSALARWFMNAQRTGDIVIRHRARAA